MALRPADNRDWYVFTGTPVPDEWVGLVYDEGTHISGLGAVVLCADNRWLLTFARLPGAGRIKSAHQAVKFLLEWADQRRIVLVAFCDADKCGAETWMQRLGFTPTPEQREGIDLWVRQ